MSGEKNESTKAPPSKKGFPKFIFPNIEGSLKDRIYRFYMHLFFYFGLMAYLPWIVLRLVRIDRSSLTDAQTQNFFLFIGFIILTLLVMDNYGVRSMHLDRLSRYLTSIGAIFGAMCTLTLYIYLYFNSWNADDTFLLNLIYMIAWDFCFLGWFHIRAERGMKVEERKPKYRSAALSFLIIFIAFFLGLITVNAIFPFMFFAMITYPILLTRYEGFKVEIQTKVRYLTKKLRQITLGSFIFDSFKAIGLTAAVFALMFDAKVLYEGDWMKNFITVSLMAGISLFVYDQLKTKMMGLAPVTLCFIFAIIQFIVSHFFYFEYQIFVLDLLNGLVLGGVFFFIEQKAEKSVNIRALAGLYYMNISAIFIFGIIVRSNPLFNDLVEKIKLFCSVFGIANIIGYMKSVNDAKKMKQMMN